MDSKAALEKIKGTELKAKERIEEARKYAYTILHDAGLQKSLIIQEAKEQAEREAQELSLKLQEGAVLEVAMLEKQAQEEIRALKERAQNNLDKALSFLKQKIGL